eukprot:TRINITY_DN24478_c0_g1_i1.p1 TRINITY_DN24478_c0_g1~~TRINITY_DN24478_c0_g1_i1.p1  ORF type:complete len:296 (+),score=62.55 TRINITY_DN24478_c0_g1_i1:94-981(+)
MVKKVERHPVVAELARGQQSNKVRLIANYLNEENQERALDFMKTHSDELREFKLQGAISSAGLQRFLPVIRKSVASLRTLQLSGNNLGPSDIQTLLEVLDLPNNKVLSVLNLVGNPLGDVGFKAVAEAIKTNTTLESVMLKRCNVTDRGVEWAAPALAAKARPRSPTGLYLALSGNMIGLDGHDFLAGLCRERGWLSLTLTKQKPWHAAMLQRTVEQPPAPPRSPAAAPPLPPGAARPASLSRSASPAVRRRRVLRVARHKSGKRLPVVGRVGGRVLRAGVRKKSKRKATTAVAI